VGLGNSGVTKVGVVERGALQRDEAPQGPSSPSFATFPSASQSSTSMTKHSYRLATDRMSGSGSVDHHPGRSV
jgi:hypothetical protein